MTQSRHRACGFLMAVGGATHLPPPRSGNSVAGGPRLLIRQSLPAYLAANLHIWRPSHYPPPVDAVGSLQLGPNNKYIYIIYSSQTMKTINMNYVIHTLSGLSVRGKASALVSVLQVSTRSRPWSHILLASTSASNLLMSGLVNIPA